MFFIFFFFCREEFSLWIVKKIWVVPLYNETQWDQIEPNIQKHEIAEHTLYTKYNDRTQDSCN